MLVFLATAALAQEVPFTAEPHAPAATVADTRWTEGLRPCFVGLMETRALPVRLEIVLTETTTRVEPDVGEPLERCVVAALASEDPPRPDGEDELRWPFVLSDGRETGPRPDHGPQVGPAPPPRRAKRPTKP